MATFLLSTTGTETPVIINDLGARTFTHPIVDFDLTDEYTLEELRDSEDLRSKIVAGSLTAKLDTKVITDGATFDEAMQDYQIVRIESAEGDITQNTTDIGTNATNIGNNATAIGNNASDISTLQASSHTQNSDTALASGTADEVTANEIRNFIDNVATVGGITVVGFWDAATNTPDLSALTLSQGQAYQVSVAGSTNLNGETNWQAKDLVVWSDTLAGNYFKIDNTDDVISVNGQTGAVTLNSTDLNHTQAVPTDWTVADGSSVGEHLDEVGDRLTTLEGAAVGKSWTYSVGENGNLSGDRDLKRVGSSRTNITPFIIPVAGSIWGITTATAQGINETYDIQVIINGAVGYTHSVTTADKSFDGALNVAVSAGDEIRLRFILGATGQVKDLGVDLYISE